MPQPLSPTTIGLVKATVPALEAHGLAITTRMYERLFTDPEMRNLFNASHQGAAGGQPKALAMAVLAYARHIDDLGALGGAVERIAQKHVALNILPEHYPHVATALLGAIQDVLGDAATAEICAAWGEAYWFLAEILIGREAALYRDQAHTPGGWNGWRDFVVERVVDESETIRSFILVPRDGGAVPRHRPGQYLGLRIDRPEGGSLRRNYSISCAPGDRAYRITVKREAGSDGPAGIVSSWLHGRAIPGTVVMLTPPAGEFILDRQSADPVVLVSGGVGFTPMMSMLETLVAEAPDRPVWYVHAALNGRVHAMREHVRALAAGSHALKTHTIYATPEAQDREGVDYDATGLLTAEDLAALTPMDRATYYLCGPTPFLAALVHGLARSGVPTARIRYEFFGPADSLEAIPQAA